MRSVAWLTVAVLVFGGAVANAAEVEKAPPADAARVSDVVCRSVGRLVFRGPDGKTVTLDAEGTKEALAKGIQALVEKGTIPPDVAEKITKAISDSVDKAKASTRVTVTPGTTTFTLRGVGPDGKTVTLEADGTKEALAGRLDELEKKGAIDPAVLENLKKAFFEGKFTQGGEVSRNLIIIRSPESKAITLDTGADKDLAEQLDKLKSEKAIPPDVAEALAGQLGDLLKQTKAGPEHRAGAIILHRSGEDTRVLRYEGSALENVPKLLDELQRGGVIDAETREQIEKKIKEAFQPQE